MEQKIEGTVDNFLDRMASELYLGSVWFGLLLILVGAVLLFKKRNSNNNKFVCYACNRISRYCKWTDADVIH